jgi:arylsulfatase A-like enzyme
MPRRPNILFVFADQWRRDAIGFTGDPNVRTPYIDRFSAQSVDVTHAVSGVPVCAPYRGSLMTGQYPHRHGVFVNDQAITSDAVPLGEAFRSQGYDTAYIGKWHLTLHDRLRPIAKHERLGFDFWRGFGCSHDYNKSSYFADDETTPRLWEGYDAFAQTREACRYLAARREAADPFFMVMSWGPPHDPYDTAPEPFRKLYDARSITLRSNVPPELADRARDVLAGYYAHVSALDACFQLLLDGLRDAGLEDDTIVVLASDHGDMIGSHGLWKKQHPYDESVRVPFLVRWPAGLGTTRRSVAAPLDAPDVMPTLLGLAGLDVPATVQGRDFSGSIRTGHVDPDAAALLACYCPFHELTRAKGGREYRGLRTPRYTYVRDLAGPWLLFDNAADPHQQANRATDPAMAGVRAALDAQLQDHLRHVGDDFATGDAMLQRHGIRLDASGDVYYCW